MHLMMMMMIVVNRLLSYCVEENMQREKKIESHAFHIHTVLEKNAIIHGSSTPMESGGRDEESNA